MVSRDERSQVNFRRDGLTQAETGQVRELEEDLLSPLRSREGWAGFVRAAAALPSLDFRNRSSPREWCICPFDKTGSMTISGTGTSPVLRLAHATS